MRRSTDARTPGPAITVSESKYRPVTGCRQAFPVRCSMIRRIVAGVAVEPTTGISPGSLF